MEKKTVVNAVESVVGSNNLLAEFDAIMAEQLPDIAKTAEMLVSVERWETDKADAEKGIADLLFGVLDSQGPLTLAWYDVVRLAWGDAYISAKGLASDNNNARDVAWSRAYKLVTNAYEGMTKPSAGTKDSEKKAAQREKQAELLAAYVDTPIADIQAEVKSLFNKAGDGDKEAKKQADKLVKVIDAKKKAETKESNEMVSALRKSIKELVGKCYDVDVLSGIRAMLINSVDDADLDIID